MGVGHGMLMVMGESSRQRLGSSLNQTIKTFGSVQFRVDLGLERLKTNRFLNWLSLNQLNFTGLGAGTAQVWKLPNRLCGNRTFTDS